MLNFRLYTEDIPISVNNQTDPFFSKEVYESTIKVLKCMERFNMKNPVMLITKGYISQKQAEELSNIKLKVIILYTFSGLSEKLENRIEEKQIQSLENVYKYKSIKLVNYYRPVIEGINTSEECIEHVAKIVTKYCEASIISGVRLNTHLSKVFDDLNIYVPKEYDPDHKVLLPETFNRINNIFEKVNPNYPTFKKTSCGVSYILGRPDYNGHSARIYYCNPSCKSYSICIGTNKIGFCKPNCPNFAICKAESKKQVTEEEFKKLLEKIGAKGAKFQILDHYIKLEGEYWQEEVSYLRHVTKKNIKADSLKKREDERLISM
ncbi:MAG: hypothetical protein ACI4ON_02680 [Clostridia bacterium]